MTAYRQHPATPRVEHGIRSCCLEHGMFSMESTRVSTSRDSFRETIHVVHPFLPAADVFPQADDSPVSSRSRATSFSAAESPQETFKQKPSESSTPWTKFTHSGILHDDPADVQLDVALLLGLEQVEVGATWHEQPREELKLPFHTEMLYGREHRYLSQLSHCLSAQ